MKLTRKNIHECSTKNGGWNKAQLAVLGIDWPPAKGWISRLDGKEITDEEYGELMRLRYLHCKDAALPTARANRGKLPAAMEEYRKSAKVVADEIKEMLPAMTPDMRKEFFDWILEDYCPDCGGDRPCYCHADE